MKIDENDWHNLRDKLYILQKRIKEVLREREEMVSIIQGCADPYNDYSCVESVKFLERIGELDD